MPTLARPLARTLIRGTLVLAAAAAAAPLMALAGPPTAPAATRAAVADAAMAAALARAAEATPQKVAEFRAALQSVAGGFQPVQTGTTPGEAKWNVVTLNTRGKRVDAVRFRTPPAEKLADFNWVVALPPSVTVWYVAPAAGEMEGFAEFHKLTASAVKGHKLPAKHTVVAQQLPAANLKPDADYLLWFTFADDKPAEVHAAINFTKPAAGGPKADVLKSLGL